MGKSIQTMRYLGNDILLEELPLLDGEFDIEGEITLASCAAIDGWGTFINCNNDGKGIKYE